MITSEHQHWVHWANSRISEKESHEKNKENGTDGALSSFKRLVRRARLDSVTN